MRGTADGRRGARDFCLNLRAGRRLRLKLSGPIGMRSSPQDGNHGALCALAAQGGAGADAPPRDSAELRGLTAKIRGAFFNSGFDWGEEHPYLPADFFAGCGVFAHIKKWAGFDWDAAKEAKKSCAFPHQARRVLLPRAGFHLPNPLSVSLFIPGSFKIYGIPGCAAAENCPNLRIARGARSLLFSSRNFRFRIMP